MYIVEMFLRGLKFFSPDPGNGGGDGGNPAPTDGGTPNPSSEIMIPKHRFDEVSKKAQEYEATIADLSEKLKVAEANGLKVAELEKKIEELEKGHESEKVLASKTEVIKKLVGDRVVDFEVFLSLIDLDKVEITKEGKTKGLAAQVKQLQKDKAYLFKPAKRVVKPGAGDTKTPTKTYAQQLAERKKKQLSAAKDKTYFK